MAERTAPRWLIATAVVAVVALVVLAGGGLWVKRQVDPSGSPGRTVNVDIPEGTSTNGVIDLLARAHVVTNREVFKLYVKLKGAGPFQAGLYHLHKRSAMGDVISELDRGPALPPAVNITIPEGLVLLTSLAFAFEAVKSAPSEITRMDEAQAVLEEALSRVRELSFELRPALLDHLGLLPALRCLI